MIANNKELVTDLVVKAKQVEYIIKGLSDLEAGEIQVGLVSSVSYSLTTLLLVR